MEIHSNSQKYRIKPENQDQSKDIKKCRNYNWFREILKNPIEIIPKAWKFKGIYGKHNKHI